MSSMKPCSVLPLVVALAALATLAACGGGSDSSGSPVATDPQAPTTPTTPSDPTPPSNPTPPSDPTTPPGDPTPPQTDITLEPGYTPFAATLTISVPNWPAWSHSGTATVDGVGCAKNENYHIHALVSIYRDGTRLLVPDSIGRGSGCAYEMHTHDGSGVVHIETDVPKAFTLGQFFALWGQPLSATTVAGLPGTPTYYVIDNEKVTRVVGDPAALLLQAHREIVIVTGTPPVQVPRYDWSATGL